MRRALFFAVLVLAGETMPLFADDLLPWLPADKLPKNAKLQAKSVIVDGPAQPAKVLEVSDPKAPHPVYVLRGKIKYEGVDQAGYIEMWSHFGDQAYFTRTLEAAGPLGKIAGKSDWRDLALPFRSKPGMLPDKLVVNVVLPGNGRVELGELTLSEFKDGTLNKK